MDKKQQIREGLKKLAQTVGPMQTILATVVSVDEAESTCVINDGDIDINDVRLRPVINGNHTVTIFPKAGTWVLAARIEEDEEWMLIGVDEADKIKVVATDEIKTLQGACEWTIADGFLMKKGSETIKKIMDDLLTYLQQLTVNTNVGPSSVPINIADFIALKVRVDNFFN